MKVTSYSKQEFINLATSKNINDSNVDQLVDEYFICIEPSGGPDVIGHFVTPHRNVVSVYFDDVAEDSKKWGEDVKYWFEAKAMTPADATKLSNFIKTFSPDSQVHVYCTKGISRSKAVADFIREQLLGWDEQTPMYPPKPHSYYHVKQLLKQAWTS